MTIDRLFQCLFTLKWNEMFKAKHATLVSIGCSVLLLLANLEILIAYGVQVNLNGTMITICHSIETPETVWMDAYLMVSISPVVSCHLFFQVNLCVYNLKQFISYLLT